MAVRLRCARRVSRDRRGFFSSDATVARAWNLGPSAARPVTVLDLTLSFLQQYDPKTEIVVDDGPAPGEAAFLALDAGAAHERFGWKPRYDADAAISATARWYAAWRAKEPPGVDPPTGEDDAGSGSAVIFEPTSVAGAFVVRLEPHSDARGFFAADVLRRRICEGRFGDVVFRAAKPSAQRQMDCSAGCICKSSRTEKTSWSAAFAARFSERDRGLAPWFSDLRTDVCGRTRL